MLSSTSFRSLSNPNPESPTLDLETRNPEPETLNPQPETRNTKPETRNPKPGTRRILLQAPPVFVTDPNKTATPFAEGWDLEARAEAAPGPDSYQEVLNLEP